MGTISVLQHKGCDQEHNTAILHQELSRASTLKKRCFSEGISQWNCGNYNRGLCYNRDYLCPNYNITFRG